MTADPEIVAEWRREIAFPIQPCPVDVLVFVRKLLLAAVDPRGDGYGDHDGEGKRVDGERQIPRLVPNLRDKARFAALSGYCEKATFVEKTS